MHRLEGQRDERRSGPPRFFCGPGGTAGPIADPAYRVCLPGGGRQGETFRIAVGGQQLSDVTRPMSAGKASVPSHRDRQDARLETARIADQEPARPRKASPPSRSSI